MTSEPSRRILILQHRSRPGHELEKPVTASHKPHPDRSAELRDLLAQRILILDGAMGTMVQQHGLQEADYRGAVSVSPHGDPLG